MAARPPLAERLRARPWMAVDVVVAVAQLAVILAFAALGHAHHPPAHRFLLYLLAPAASLPLAVRRRWPRTVFAVVLAASVAVGIIDSATTVSGASYALYTVAVQADLRWSWLALVAAEAGVAMSFALTTRSTSNPVNGAFTALVQLTIWIVGDSVRRHRGYTVRLREQSVRQALTDQRLQIARELHDVIAHALSIIAVQAGVGGHLIATRPEQAARSLDSIQATARDALSETRYLLGALRDNGPGDNGQGNLAPRPRIGHLGALIDQLSEAGLPATLRVEGQPRTLPASVEHSAYRVVQEALTNVRMPSTSSRNLSGSHQADHQPEPDRAGRPGPRPDDLRPRRVRLRRAARRGQRLPAQGHATRRAAHGHQGHRRRGRPAHGEIADQLVVSLATVKSHVSRLLTKLAARDRAQLIVMAYESGFVTPA